MHQAIHLWTQARARYLQLGKPISLGIAAVLISGLLAALLLRTPPSASHAPTKPFLVLPAVGIESSFDVILDRPDYKPAKIDSQSPLILRISSVQPHEKGGFIYRLLYTGMEPGTFNLTDFLLNPLGGRLKQPLAIATIHSNIPAQSQFPILHDQIRYQPKSFPYSFSMVLAVLVWTGAGVRLFRPKKTTPPPVSSHEEEQPMSEAVPLEKTLATILLPLVEKAANKSITPSEKAQIEQILLLYWGKQLELDHLDSTEQMRRIRDHTQAGALLRTMDQWLYQPGSVIGEEEIKTSLAKYDSVLASALPPPRPTPPPALEPEMTAANMVPIE